MKDKQISKNAFAKELNPEISDDDPDVTFYERVKALPQPNLDNYRRLLNQIGGEQTQLKDKQKRERPALIEEKAKDIYTERKQAQNFWSRFIPGTDQKILRAAEQQAAEEVQDDQQRQTDLAQAKWFQRRSDFVYHAEWMQQQLDNHPISSEIRKERSLTAEVKKQPDDLEL